MKIAVTGCNGRVGRCVVALALSRDHQVVGIDNNSQPSADFLKNDRFTFENADLKEYTLALKHFQGCDAVIHLAGYPNPGDYIATTHNANVVLSWNVLRACSELHIYRIAQASSVNVITMVYSQGPQFAYFPIDEQHPCAPDEPYGLSKVIAELQADTIIKRNPTMKIASLRLHWSIPDRGFARRQDAGRAKNDLWGYVQQDSAANAFLLAIAKDNDKWSGHEAFFIVAPATSFDEDTIKLKEAYWPDVPIKEGKDLVGREGFFDCEKAKRLLGWVHEETLE